MYMKRYILYRIYYKYLDNDIYSINIIYDLTFENPLPHKREILRWFPFCMEAQLLQPLFEKQLMKQIRIENNKK